LIPYRISNKTVSFVLRGKQYNIASDHPHYDQIVLALVDDEPAKLDQLVNIRNAISLFTMGTIEIKDDGAVYCRGRKVSNKLAARIMQHYEEYKDTPALMSSLVKFAEKLSENPTADVRDDLYDWLMTGGTPLYPDGDFAAYKVVRADFTSIHKGPYGEDQSPGTLVEMPRHECDDNRDQTCSSGLHFCSYDYLSVIGANDVYNKVILLKINPADVVAIPTDYGMTKGRTSRFFVVEEVTMDAVKERYNDTLITPSDDDYDYDYDDDYDDTEEETKIKEAVKPHRERYLRANAALEAADGNKTKAAADLGIPRSTLYNWLKAGEDT
jgi:hypothetical protein